MPHYGGYIDALFDNLPGAEICLIEREKYNEFNPIGVHIKYGRKEGNYQFTGGFGGFEVPEFRMQEKDEKGRMLLIKTYEVKDADQVISLLGNNRNVDYMAHLMDKMF